MAEPLPHVEEPGGADLAGLDRLPLPRRARGRARRRGTASTPAIARRTTARAPRASPRMSAARRGPRASPPCARRARCTSAGWARRRRPRRARGAGTARRARAAPRSSRPRRRGRGCGAASGWRRPPRTGPGRRARRAGRLPERVGPPAPGGRWRAVVPEPSHGVGQRTVAAADLEHPRGRGGQLRTATNGSRFTSWDGAASQRLYRAFRLNTRVRTTGGTLGPE